MKKLITAILICCFLGHFILPVKALNEQKLMQLKPLLSERLAQKAKNYEANRLWPPLIIGGLGLAIIYANISKTTVGNSELGNMAMGSMLIGLGGISFLAKNPYQQDLDSINTLGDTGLAKEKEVYLLYNNYALKEKSARELSAITMGCWGLLYALTPLLAKDATDTYKSSFTVAGVFMMGMAAMSWFFPGEFETKLEKINKELK
jgi:hypothetical protein